MSRHKSLYEALEFLRNPPSDLTVLELDDVGKHIVRTGLDEVGQLQIAYWLILAVLSLLAFRVLFRWYSGETWVRPAAAGVTVACVSISFLIAAKFLGIPRMLEILRGEQPGL
jgi:hypothetical protein